MFRFFKRLKYVEEKVADLSSFKKFLVRLAESEITWIRLDRIEKELFKDELYDYVYCINALSMDREREQLIKDGWVDVPLDSAKDLGFYLLKKRRETLNEER